MNCLEDTRIEKRQNDTYLHYLVWGKHVHSLPIVICDFWEAFPKYECALKLTHKS